MRVVVPTATGVLELNWQWLPTWLGVNGVIRREMQDAIAKKVEGKPMTQEVLDEAQEEVIAFLEERFPAIEGMRQFLDALKYIEFK